jgi:hypothetical protein
VKYRGKNYKWKELKQPDVAAARGGKRNFKQHSVSAGLENGRNV